MKINPVSWLILLLLVAVLALEYLQWQQNKEQGRDLQVKLLQLNKQVSSLDQRLLAAEQQLVQLEDSSIQRLVEEANGAIIDGWQALINAVDEELKRVRQSLKTPAQPTPEAAPGER